MIARPGIFLDMILLAVAGCSLTNGQSATNQGQFLLCSRFKADRINIQADRVDQSDVTPAELSAACQSLSDAVNDLTFGTDVIPVDSPDLLRSAELLDGEYLNEPSAYKAEETHPRSRLLA